MTGRKQQKTTNAAAIHLNMILKKNTERIHIYLPLTRVVMTTTPAGALEERQGL